MVVGRNFIIAGILILAIVAISGCCCFTGSQDSSSSASSTSPYSKATPTVKPSAAASGYALYKTWDTDKIKASAQKVDWQDFARNTDSYEGKLIMIHGDIVTATQISGGYTYDVNTNPNLMSDHSFSDTSTGNNYNAQFISFDYGSKLIEGDIVDIYGVYEGDSTWLGQYPIIKAVYVVYYD